MPDIVTESELVSGPNFIDHLDQIIPPEAPAVAFTYGVLAAGALGSLATRERWPMVAALQGLAGATISNTTDSITGHRQVKGHSVELSPNTNTVFRFGVAAMSGVRLDRSVPVHRQHHRYTDRDFDDERRDPHSPSLEGGLRLWTSFKRRVREASEQLHDLTAEAQQDPTTRRMAFDHPAFTATGVIGGHMAVGEILNQPVPARLISAGIHVLGNFVQKGTFIVSSHGPDGPRDLNHDPLTQIVNGGESWHGKHHRRPNVLRGAKYDPGYVVVRGLEFFGLAKVKQYDHPQGDNQQVL